MPRLPLKIGGTVFFLYLTEEAAKTGSGPGGTGFVVSYPRPFGDPDEKYVYIVTCKHNLIDGGSTWIRCTGNDGNVHIEEIQFGSWVISETADVAVTRYFAIAAEEWPRFDPINVEWGITDEIIKEHQIGPGDEVFMVGRFSPIDSAENVPAARCGYISVLPEVNAEYYVKGEIWTQPSYLVDMGNRAGFSGSPVFLYTIPYRVTWTPDGEIIIGDAPLFQLLGVCTGFYDDDRGNKEDVARGLTIVTPAKKITELIEGPELKGERDAMNAHLRRHYEETNMGVATGDPDDVGSDFMSDLRKASTKKADSSGL